MFHPLRADATFKPKKTYIITCIVLWSRIDFPVVTKQMLPTELKCGKNNIQKTSSSLGLITTRIMQTQMKAVLSRSATMVKMKK